MDRDNRTRTGAKDPWGREAGAASRTAARGGTAGLDTERGHRVRSGSVRRVEANRATEAGMPGAGLTADAFGKARPDRLAFKPYRGRSSRQDCKPTGGSPVVTVAQHRSRSDATPRAGNRPGNAWCIRPGRPDGCEGVRGGCNLGAKRAWEPEAKRMTAASKVRPLLKLQDRACPSAKRLSPAQRPTPAGKKWAKAPGGDGGVWVQAPTQGVQG